MKVLIQRVTNANVVVEEKEVSKIGKGYLLLVGIEKDDNKANILFLFWKLPK